MQKQSNLIFVVIFTVCLFGVYADVLRQRGKSGPYNIHLTAIHKCDKPKPSYLKEARSIHLEVYNTSSKVNLVRGNATFIQGYSNFMGKAKQYKWLKGKWKLNLVINSDHCNGPLKILLRLITLKYDTEHCSLAAGYYYVKDIDANALGHALMPKMDYGRAMWKIEVFIKTGMLFCYEFECQVVPA